MHRLQEEGLFTRWGVSNWKFARLKAAHEFALQHGMVMATPVCDSTQFSLAMPCRAVWPGTTFVREQEEWEEGGRKEWYREHKVAVLAWECLAKGFCAGILNFHFSMLLLLLLLFFSEGTVWVL